MGYDRRASRRGYKDSRNRGRSFTSERNWRLQWRAIERPSVEVVKEPKRRATTADSDCGVLAQQKYRRTHWKKKNKLTPTLEVGAESATCKSHQIYHSKVRREQAEGTQHWALERHEGGSREQSRQPEWNTCIHTTGNVSSNLTTFPPRCQLQ